MLLLCHWCFRIMLLTFNLLTLDLFWVVFIMASANNLCKQFGPRSGRQNKRRAWSVSKLFDTLVFRKKEIYHQNRLILLHICLCCSLPYRSLFLEVFIDCFTNTCTHVYVAFTCMLFVCLIWLFTSPSTHCQLCRSGQVFLGWTSTKQG